MNNAICKKWEAGGEWLLTDSKRNLTEKNETMGEYSMVFLAYFLASYERNVESGVYCGGPKLE